MLDPYSRSKVIIIMIYKCCVSRMTGNNKTVTDLLSTFVKEGERSALCMDEATLFHKDTEQLRVKEMTEEWPLCHWDVLEEQLLVKEEGGIARSLGGSREEGAETHPIGGIPEHLY